MTPTGVWRVPNYNVGYTTSLLSIMRTCANAVVVVVPILPSSSYMSNLTDQFSTYASIHFKILFNSYIIST